MLVTDDLQASMVDNGLQEICVTTNVQACTGLTFKIMTGDAECIRRHQFMTDRLYRHSDFIDAGTTAQVHSDRSMQCRLAKGGIGFSEQRCQSKFKIGCRNACIKPGEVHQALPQTSFTASITNRCLAPILNSIEYKESKNIAFIGNCVA